MPIDDERSKHRAELWAGVSFVLTVLLLYGYAIDRFDLFVAIVALWLGLVFLYYVSRIKSAVEALE